MHHGIINKQQFLFTFKFQAPTIRKKCEGTEEWGCGVQGIKQGGAGDKWQNYGRKN